MDEQAARPVKDSSISHASKTSQNFKINKAAVRLEDTRVRSKSASVSFSSKQGGEQGRQPSNSSGQVVAGFSAGGTSSSSRVPSKGVPIGSKLPRKERQRLAVAKIMDESKKHNSKFSVKMQFIESERLNCMSLAKDLMQKTKELDEKVYVDVAPAAVPEDELIPGTNLHKNFYVDAMLNILAEKWKNRKFSLVHSEKMDALRTKYEAVQKIINNVMMASLKEKEGGEKDRRREMKKNLFKKMDTQYDTSINRASTYKSVVGKKKERFMKLMESDKKELTDSILQNSQMNLSLELQPISPLKGNKHGLEISSLNDSFSRKNTFGEGTASPNSATNSFKHLKVYGISADDFRNTSGYQVEKRRKDIKSTDKVLKDLRLKIDATYMKFAKRNGYNELYKKEKDELAETNEAFRANLRNFRRKRQINDNFLGGDFIEHLRPGILSNPLKNIYIETHKSKFDNPDARYFDNEDREIFEEETKKLLETHLPEEFAYLQPKLLSILRSTRLLDVGRQNIKTIKDVNSQTVSWRVTSSDEPLVRQVEAQPLL